MNNKTNHPVGCSCGAADCPEWLAVQEPAAATHDDIKSALLTRGPTYYGDYDRVDEIAQEWIDCGFGVDSADWMDAGFWCPSTAEEVRNLGIDPSDVARLAKDITGYDDPVYSMCLGDLDVASLITLDERKKQ